jgi:tyrosyl-tRNA synthetase
MMAKDSVKKRLELDTGMSFTEFSYQLVQGYDFLWLFENKGVKLQMGGSDQWGNIVTGTELIRKKGVGSAFALTTPLIKKADGSKFGKSESGNIWLDPKKTSPFKFYQFWLNANDTDAESWIKVFTFLDQSTINRLIEEQRTDASKRILQKALAKEVTIFVHGIDEYNKAVETTEKLFAGQDTAAESLSEEDLNNMEGIVKVDYPSSKIVSGIDVVSFLAETNIFPSKGEAKKMIQGGGVSINRKKIDSIQQSIDNSLLLHDKYFLVQKGRKNYYLVKVS